jgi:hypothetical protein
MQDYPQRAEVLQAWRESQVCQEITWVLKLK